MHYFSSVVSGIFYLYSKSILVIGFSNTTNNRKLINYKDRIK